MRALLGTLVLATAVVATADIEHTILHGVEVGSVRVWVGPGELPGMSEEQLQTSVETQLREAGVEITPGASAQLLVTVGLYTGPGCFADIKAFLAEDALLERNGMHVEARSWQTGGTAMLRPQNDCGQLIPEAVERAAGDFIEMYSAMNPRE